MAGGARGSRVALVCANSIDLAIAMFAAHAAGAQAVPINPAYTGREIRHILADAEQAHRDLQGRETTGMVILTP